MGAFRKMIEESQDAEEPVKSWTNAVFTDKDVLKRAEKHPGLFAEVINAYRLLTLHAQDEGLGVGLDDQLKQYLDALPPKAAARVAATLVNWHWGRPNILGGKLRDWIVRQPGAVDARLLNMLWNDGDFESICTAIACGADTSTASYVDIEGQLELEGFYNGYIEPLEHLLGSYLRLVDLVYPDGVGPVDDMTLSEEVRDGITLLGGQSPELRGPQENYLKGKEKIAGARRVLQALTEAGTAQILTSYTEVLDCSLVKEFANNPGTIWGFEHVRLPFVNAVHTTEFGKHPVRMWEMWAAVELILNEWRYLQLLLNPEAMIPKLVAAGVRKLDDQIKSNPVEYAGLTDPGARGSSRRGSSSSVRPTCARSPSDPRPRSSPPRTRAGTTSPNTSACSAARPAFGGRRRRTCPSTTAWTASRTTT
ncbi:hypothetical protein Prum_006950 [Phytohabitans rumicis]|uniref:Uncharacterized protein n=2 Tax=Phytohabitans rumicis TaxID=1076125 RepID=A0A6V8KPE8_9ACTN|nr:hypothetical protein Prum_006950 [Phytohabitans rumicis]